MSVMIYILILQGIVGLLACAGWERERRNAKRAWSAWGRAMRARQLVRGPAAR